MRYLRMLTVLVAMLAASSMSFAQTSGTCGASGYDITYTFDESTHTLTFSGAGHIQSYGPTNQPWHAISGLIEHVVFEEGITKIGWRVCYQLTGLTSVSFPSTLTYISTNAFDGCTSLTSVTLPQNLETIYYRAFYGCTGLTSIAIPASVTELGEEAFRQCSNLENIYVYWSTPPTDVNNTAFNNIASGATLHVPYGKGSTYSETSPWSNFNIVEMNPQGQCGDNLFWEYNPSTTTLTITGTGDMWELDHYGGNHPWFSYRHDITTLTIEDGATYIAENAFSEFTSLVSETLPSSVTSLGAAAFSDCPALTSLTLPSGLTTIGEWGFSNSGLTSLNIPVGVTTLAEGLFDGCTSLGTVTFADGSLLTTIGIEAFLGCSSLASITIPASVTQISARAFKNCSNLVSVTFADGSLLETIGTNAFNGCTSLASIAIPAHVTQVGESAFKSCTDLATVTFVDGSASLEIGSGAFGATAITAIDIPERVTGIANVAFYKCASLADVTVHWTSAGDLPAVGVTNVFGDIAPGASLHIPCGCASVYEATTPWSSFSLVEPCVGGQCGDNLYWQYNTVTHELAITGTDDMWNYSYSISTHPWVDYRAEITSVSLPDGMTSIGSSAFYKCTGITSITIPSTVVSIGREAFAYSGLTSITIPDGITSISRSMFTECQALVSVNLPSGVTSIGVAAFYHCSVLASINLPEGLTSIELTAFNTCSSLTTITFPASLTTIEQSAFAYSGLTSIDIPAGVTTIGNQTFYRCTDLTDATVHWENMEGISVASNAFYNTASSKTLHIPCGTTSIYSGTDPWSDFSTKVEYGCPVASVTTSGSVTTNYTTFAAALAAWEANSTLTLLDNVVISDRIEVTEAKTLDLNGYGIKNDGGLHEVIYIHGSSAHLTLEDSNPDAPHKYDFASNLLATLNEASGANTVLGGYITGGNGNTTETNIYAGNNMANGGGIFVYDGATFTMNGGNIIGNRTHAISGREARHGGGVFVAKNSHFILNGGRITHNYAQYGGGVAVYGSTSDVPEQGPSDMVMTGGEISYNYATTNCGGISTNGRNAHITLTITGGTITENRLKPTATQRAGGIGFDTNMTFNLSGNPTIDDNYNASGAEENIYIGTGRMITITGDLTNTTPIGITMVTPGVFTSGIAGHGAVANFSSDDASKTIVLNHANEMALIGDANYERSSLFAGKIGTLYTGHATTYYEGATFYTIYGRNEDKTQLYFEEVTGELGDNTSYIFESAGDAIALYYADPSFVPLDDQGQNGLFGTLVGKTIDQNPEIYYIADNQLWSAASFAGSVTQLTVEANRCWIEINYVPYKAAPSPAPGKRYITLGTNGAMGIEGIERQESGVQKILRDGQIYILREGKIYNILGF